MDHSVFAKHNRKKKKRKRTVITAEEIDRLEKEFQKDPRPNRMTKMELAQELGKAENVVSTWFQNRRAREKKMARISESASHGSCSADGSGTCDVEHDTQPLNLSLKDSSEVGSRSCETTRDAENMDYSYKSVRSPLFGRLVRMAAAAEGGILSVDCPEITQAMMDACNGILLKDARLVYHPSYGFDVENFGE